MTIEKRGLFLYAFRQTKGLFNNIMTLKPMRAQESIFIAARTPQKNASLLTMIFKRGIRQYTASIFDITPANFLKYF